jgi:nucleotide-binding universal stress UspA family protein
MIAVRSILVPVDFSDCSRAALDYAEALAEKFDATLDVVHVWEITPYIPPEAMVGVPGGTTQTLAHTARATAEQQLHVFETSTKTPGGRWRKSRLESGDPARTIVEIADKDGYDLIAIGTHGRTGIGHLLMGSVAEKVLRRARCPVFVVPCKALERGD